MNIYEALRQDHDEQRRLLDLLVKTEGDSEGRHELFLKAKEALERHAAAEERAFYTPLLNEDLTQEKARHSIAEHHEIDELLESLEATDRSSSGWLATARHLRERVEHHLDEEEREVFQLSGKALDEQSKTRLAGDYRRMMEEG